MPAVGAWCYAALGTGAGVEHKPSRSGKLYVLQIFFCDQGIFRLWNVVVHKVLA